MRTSRGAGEDRSGGERWTIVRHAWRNLRRLRFDIPLRRIGASGNWAAERAALRPRDREGDARGDRRTEALRRKNGRKGAGGFDQSRSRH